MGGPRGVSVPGLGAPGSQFGPAVAGIWQAQAGRGWTPSGTGAVPPGLPLTGMQTFSQQWQNPPSQQWTQPPGFQQFGQQVGTQPQGLGEIPLSALVSTLGTQQPVGGVVVSYMSPPVPTKVADKIWRGEFIDLNTLLPYRLGAPEPTLADALQQRPRESKQIATIEQWVVCFNAYMSVVSLQQPQRLRDMLAYSSIIVKAAHDYDGKPWLSYDVHHAAADMGES